MINITILGAAGRMGNAIARGIAATSDLALVGAVERPGHPALGHDIGTLSGIAAVGIPVTDDRAAAIKKANVVIDFTFHTEAPANIAEAVNAKAAYILGTTGLNDAEGAAIHAAAKEIPVVWAPNYSLGVTLLNDLVRRAAAILGTAYDAEIVEMHHRHKKDAPSGTALGLGLSLAAGRNVNLRDIAAYGREGIAGERPEGQIAFHALRGGDVVGDHTVIFAADGERLELTHKASSRDCFVSGVLASARWLHDKAPGLYTMTHVLGL